jgi:lipoprotein Spr
MNRDARSQSNAIDVPAGGRRRRLHRSAAAFALLLTGCASTPPPSTSQSLPLAEDAFAPTESLLPDSPVAVRETTAARVHPLIERALGALGTRYRYGGNSIEKGFDCSGFVRWIYHDIAGALPRSAQALSDVEAPLVKRESLQPADIVFFRINRSRSISHVGMYVGHDQFIHAPSSGGKVRVDNIDEPYWRARFVKARRWSISAMTALAKSG